MIERHRRNKTTSRSHVHSYKFDQEIFNTRQNPQEYIEQLVRLACPYHNSNPQKMNLKELQEIIALTTIPLKNKQLHEVYLYATCDPGSNSFSSPEKITSIINSESSKIDLSRVAAWINNKISKGKPGAKLERRVRQKNWQHTQSCQIRDEQSKFPVIKTKPAHVFTSEVSKVISLFSQMEKERQNAGLEPVCLSDQEIDDRSQPTKQINYDGDFFQVNSRLFKLRVEAQRRIENVIDAAKNDNRLKRKFEEALMRYQRVRTEANEKMGKCGAMKAQKRMVDKTKVEVLKLQSWREKTNQTQFQKKYY